MLSHFTSVTSKQSNSQGWVCLSLEGMILGDPHSGTYRHLLNTQDKIHINEKQFLSDCDQCALHHSHMCAEINRENDQFRLRENSAGENGKLRPKKGSHFSLEVPWYSSQIRFILCVLKHFLFEKTIQTTCK